MREQATSGLHRVPGKCILIVDDDSDAAELYAMWVARDGHEAHVASDAISGAVLAIRTLPDFALIDVGLPGLDGIELLGILGKLPGLESCRYVAVTAYADPGMRARCLATGFAAYLEKPVTQQVLLDCLFAGSAALLSHASG